MSGRLLGVALLFLAGPALAGPRDFVVELASSGASPEQAAPFIQKFLEFAETALGWPAKSSQGQFFDSPAAAEKYIATTKPGFGVLDSDLFFELRKKDALKALASLTGPELGHLHIVVKDPAIKTIADLKGKTLVSNHLQSPKFLSRVAFEGKIDVKSHFKLVDSTGMLKGVKAVDRGEAEATLLSDAEVESLKKMSFPDLHVIWSSPELPPPVVVAFGKNAKPADQEAVAKMLLGMCADPKGAEVCKQLHITKFTPPAAAAYDAAQKRFDRP